MDVQLPPPLDSARARTDSRFGPQLRSRRLRFTVPPTPLGQAQLPTLQRIQQQSERIRQFQKRWERIKTDLPPQLSRKHISMISIGGVVGTGLFLGSADALRYGGPLGAFLGYAIIGSVVYCLCVSVGEMISFLPNVGGVVGLADLYVDPALGFSLGWAAWYNWSVTLPAEITAAAVVIQYWPDASRIPIAATSAIFLFIAIGINCFSSRIYGEVEFYLSSIKVVTIVVIIVLGILIDLGASAQGPILFKNWRKPFPPDYLGIGGAKGQFLGFWAVIMQAAFSFFGSEVPGIAAGEVIDATRNVPRALRRVWIRITLFYVGGIFVAGLLVPNSVIRGVDSADGTGRASPFVIAFTRAGYKIFPDLINAAILLSAWSAAASDIYISSRFLFFLARQSHAPSFLAWLVRYPQDSVPENPEGIELESDDPGGLQDDDDDDSDNEATGRPDISEDSQVTLDVDQNPDPDPVGEPVVPRKEPWLVLPLASVLASSSVGLLTFLSRSAGSADEAFQWLVAVASVASLQSWAAMLFTYLRWWQGTRYAENKHRHIHEPESLEVIKQIDVIKRNRHRFQPYLAWYAFSICMVVLFTNGWAVFVHNSWQIAIIPGEEPPQYPEAQRHANPVSLFLSSYIPIPLFILLTIGYKLIEQTRMVQLEEMTFSRQDVPEFDPDQDMPRNVWERFLAWAMII